MCPGVRTSAADSVTEQYLAALFFAKPRAVGQRPTEKAVGLTHFSNEVWLELEAPSGLYSESVSCRPLCD